MDIPNTLGVVVGSLLIAFGLTVIIWARQVLRITKDQLRLLFGDRFMQDAPPATVRIGGASAVIVGTLMLFLGLSQQL